MDATESAPRIENVRMTGNTVVCRARAAGALYG
jgi:hypothetical protein